MDRTDNNRDAAPMTAAEKRRAENRQRQAWLARLRRGPTGRRQHR